MKKTPVIILKNITKLYTLHHEKPTFSEQILRKSRNEKFLALSNVSASFFKGEVIGIIGSNGSGKTTLLKIITGITTATSGTIQTSGRIVSLIDLEAGFHPELTGEENIFLNGLVIGMSKKEITEKLKSIIEFADIGKFIDAPLFTYSQGMKLRLGFSVAVHANPDILILDEGIAVGDENFRKKSSEKIEEFFKQSKTIIIASHWLDYLEQHCTKIVWVEKGKFKKIGGKNILKKYSVT